jgi:hypothetical protein
LREVLGYRKARVIEVSEETYKLLEEWREKLKARNLDEALYEALLSALGRK